MAIALVQQSTVETGSSFTVIGTHTLPGSTTSGNLLVAFCWSNGNGSAVTCSVSDDINGAWTQAVTEERSGYPTLFMFYKENITGGNTTITFSGTGANNAAMVAEFSGIATSAFDASFDATEESAAWPGTTQTVNSAASNATAESLILAMHVTAYSNTSYAVSATGYTTLATRATSGGSNVGYYAGYKTVSASASQSAVISWTQSAYAVGYIAAFAGSGGSSTPIPRSMLLGIG